MVALFLYYGLPLVLDLLKQGWIKLAKKCGKKRRGRQSPVRASTLNRAFESLRKGSSNFKDRLQRIIWSEASTNADHQSPYKSASVFPRRLAYNDYSRDPYYLRSSDLQ